MGPMNWSWIFYMNYDFIAILKGWAKDYFILDIFYFSFDSIHKNVLVNDNKRILIRVLHIQI